MEERYAAAARAGFKGVEVAFPYDYAAPRLHRILKENNLSLVQILAPFNWDAGERGLAAIPGKEEEFKKSILQAIEYGIQVGKPMIHVMPGNISPELNWDKCYETFRGSI